jgi:hypothetical protein
MHTLAAPKRRSRLFYVLAWLVAAGALLAGFASSASAIGVYKYGLVGGVLYSSGAWEAGGTSDLYNGDTQNIGVAYVEIYRNGYGFWASNYPGVFLTPGQAAIVCIAGNCNPGYSVLGKCKSSNTRAHASCAIG